MEAEFVVKSESDQIKYHFVVAHGELSHIMTFNMGEYRFVPANQLGSAVGFADAAAKGHAIRSGIRRGWTTAELADSRSRETRTQGKELQGRFRIPMKSKRVTSKRSHLSKEAKVVGQDRKSLRAGRRVRQFLIHFSCLVQFLIVWIDPEPINKPDRKLSQSLSKLPNLSKQTS